MGIQKTANQCGPVAFCLKKAADLLGNEYTIGFLLPRALVGLHWLTEVSA